jgi:preprotein translocase subunit SecG
VKATIFLSILFALLSIALNIKGLRDTGTEKGIIESELEQGGGQTVPGE